MAAPKGNNGFVGQRRKTALERFAEKCAFDPVTGCVMWVGGVSSGRGTCATYGVFWDENRRHFAHRWAAVKIHGLSVGKDPVGHCCPAGPNTLCVEHVKATTVAENNAEQWDRLGRPEQRIPKAEQTTTERQYWLFVQKGIEPEPEAPPQRRDGIPWFEPPAWLAPFLKQEEPTDDDCPF